MLTKMNTLRIVNVSSLFYSHDFVQDISNLFKNWTQRHTTHFKTEAILIQAIQGLKNALKLFSSMKIKNWKSKTPAFP